MLRCFAIVLAVSLHGAGCGVAQASVPAVPAAEDETQTAILTAAQVFEVAEAASRSGDERTAEAAYRALFADADVRIRNEARFRLAMLHLRQQRLTDAALLLRRILDEEPGAQRVRLELGRVLDLMGDEAGARRALREAQAAGLPPEVARLVERYSAALRSRKPLGASLELALAPDSNINRAPRSDTLGTVLGDFTLDEEAQETSGVGVAIRGQAFARHEVGGDVTLIARAGASADFYRHSAFDDLSLAVAAGPEFASGRDRIALEAGRTWRWFGRQPYSETTSIGVNWFHPLDRRSQLRVIASAAAIDNRRNPLQDGEGYALSLGYERALSERSGIGVSIAADRQDLRDPGHATTGGQASLLFYRDIGATTLVATVGLARLEADARQFIFPRRRVDDLVRGSIAATFRRLAVAQFAPLVRVIAEHNRSSVSLFDYRRLRLELGVSRAF